jgi:hypothetical protein
MRALPGYIKESIMRNPKKTSLAAVGLALSLFSLMAAGPASAQGTSSQQVQARVTTVNQVTEADGRTAYNVTYEFNGRPYTMRTDVYPGATVPVEVNAYGVATMPVAPQSGPAPSGMSGDPSPWDRVVPEPGVVVSGGARVAPPVYYAAPAYAAPAYPAPVYVQPAYGYGAPYGYAAPYAYPPVGLSLNLGYSRGWGGGHRHGWR